MGITSGGNYVRRKFGPAEIRSFKISATFDLKFRQNQLHCFEKKVVEVSCIYSANQNKNIHSLGMKFDIKFKNISMNVLTCQLGSVLMLRCCRHGKMVMLLFIAAESALL